MHLQQRVPTLSTPPAVRWALTGATTPGSRIRTWEIRAPLFQIGRRSENDLCVPSPVVSGLHAQVVCNRNTFVIRDAGSTNGTWVNGKQITGDCCLSDGDVVEIGEALLRFHKLEQTAATGRTSPLLNNTVSVQDNIDRAVQRNLAELLREKSILPCYQAIHNLETEEICGHEFLARSCSPGIESAGQLFEQARIANQEVQLSVLCRERAMYYSPLLDRQCPIFVNTHPAEPLLDVVVPQMRELKLQYPQVDMVVEIHEAAMTDPDLIRETREQLADCGVRLAFDDFGRGQARIRELICTQSDFIKFDSALIADLQHVLPEQFRLFRSIIRGIQDAGAITVAEGVETEGMADVCREIGFDLVQGFLFSRPKILGNPGVETRSR